MSEPHAALMRLALRLSHHSLGLAHSLIVPCDTCPGVPKRIERMQEIINNMCHLITTEDEQH